MQSKTLFCSGGGEEGKDVLIYCFPLSIDHRTCIAFETEPRCHFHSEFENWRVLGKEVRSQDTLPGFLLSGQCRKNPVRWWEGSRGEKGRGHWHCKYSSFRPMNTFSRLKSTREIDGNRTMGFVHHDDLDWFGRAEYSTGHDLRLCSRMNPTAG